MTKSPQSKRGNRNTKNDKGGAATPPLFDVIEVRLTPKSSSDRVGETIPSLGGGDGVQLKIYVTAPPEDGKANAAMLRVLADHLGVAVSRLTLISGQTSRNKRVRVD